MNDLADLKSTTLTKRDIVFLDAIFLPECKGDVSKAAVIAGIPKGSLTATIKRLRDEIINRAKDYLALHSPKAAMEIVNGIEGTSTQLQVKSATHLLDRVGIVKEEKVTIDGKMEHGIFLIPAKDTSGPEPIVVEHVPVPGN